MPPRTWSAPSSRRSPTSPRSAPKTQLERLIEHIHRVAPGVPVILDAKRGDIGATAEQYAREAFERYRADALTLSPFMGFDSIEPYLRWQDKGLILLCRTSNPGGSDLQAQRLAGGEHALRAHRPAGLRALEQRRPARPGGRRHLPGRDRARARAGADAAAADPGHRRPGRRCRGHGARRLARRTRPIIVSSSRAILYASAGADFAEAARRVAQATRLQLNAARGVN